MSIRELYEFGEFTLDASERRLSHGGQPIALAPKAHDLLVALVRNAGRLVTKRELLDLVWPDSYVDEGILAVHVSALRKALGQDEKQHYIETVSRSGYRFAADVIQPDVLKSEELRSLAVLPARPFAGEILSGKDRSVGLAITDALIERLGRSSRIIVRPTGAVRTHVGSSDDPVAFGRELRVDAVIDSHFLGSADGVTISVHLIRSRDGAILWSGNFAESPTGLIAAVDVVAERVLINLGLHSQGDENSRERLRLPTNPEVYELLGRGRFHLLAASMFELPKAIEAFQAAIRIDPTYAPAHAGLARAYCAQAAYRLIPPAEAYN
jgi:DNA-binding winged helix-turn-helix (wHTH) protein